MNKRTDLKHLKWSLMKRGLSKDEAEDHIKQVLKAERANRMSKKRLTNDFTTSFKELKNRKRNETFK